MANSNSSGKPQKVLVAEDEQTIRYVLRRLLERDGLEVVCAENGAEALELFEQERPDLVMLDVMMPVMNGFEVCEKLKSRPENKLIPVIIVTASSSKENRMHGLEIGADDFLSKPVDHVELIARVRSLLRIKRYTDELERAEAVLFAMAQAIEGKDPCTEGHCERLSVYAQKLGLRLGRPEDEILALKRAGIVHDIGKIAVPDAILLKNGKLTEAEFAVIKEHPVVGERICKSLKSFALVLPMIRHHHEKQDGSGYPDGLSGDQIPTTACILQVVDVFDALTTKRPYKDAFSIESALKTMQEEVDKGWWEPHVFDAFRDMVQEGGFCLEHDESSHLVVPV